MGTQIVFVNCNDDMMWFVLFVSLFVFIRQLGLLSDLVLAN